MTDLEATRKERNDLQAQLATAQTERDAAIYERDLAAKRLGWKRGEVVEDRVTQLEAQLAAAQARVQELENTQCFKRIRELEADNARLTEERDHYIQSALRQVAKAEAAMQERDAAQATVAGLRLAAVRAREEIADWYKETFCPQSGVGSDETHARGDCAHCNVAGAIRRLP